MRERGEGREGGSEGGSEGGGSHWAESSHKIQSPFMPPKLMNIHQIMHTLTRNTVFHFLLMLPQLHTSRRRGSPHLVSIWSGWSEPVHHRSLWRWCTALQASLL